jgi:hypothetical protein
MILSNSPTEPLAHPTWRPLASSPASQLQSLPSTFASGCQAEPARTAAQQQSALAGTQRYIHILPPPPPPLRPRPHENSLTHPTRPAAASSPTVSPSVGFYAILREWYLDYRGHEGGNYRNTKTIEANLDLTFKCLTNGAYTGAGYGFRSKRRDTGSDVTCAGEEEENECSGYQRPDVFETDDGKKLSLLGLRCWKFSSRGRMDRLKRSGRRLRLNKARVWLWNVCGTICRCAFASLCKWVHTLAWCVLAKKMTMNQ